MERERDCEDRDIEPDIADVFSHIDEVKPYQFEPETSSDSESAESSEETSPSDDSSPDQRRDTDRLGNTDW